MRTSFNDIPDPLGGTTPLSGGASAPSSAELPPLPAVAHAAIERAPDRAEMSRRKTGALMLSLAWLASHLAVFGVRHDLGELSLSYLLSQLAAPFVLAVASLYVATRPGRWGLGTPWRWVALLAVAGPLSFALLGLVMPPPHAVAPDPRPWLTSLVCSDVMLAYMSAPLFSAAFALRAAFAATPVWRSGLVGASVGLLSGVTINLHCPNVQPWHLAIGHGVPIVLGSLFGAFVVTRWLRA